MRGLRRSYSLFHPPMSVLQYPSVVTIASLKAATYYRRTWGHGVMKSSGIKKRSIIIARHKTSVSIEDEFWAGLREIAKGRGQPISQLIADIDEGRQFANLSSAIRLFVLRHYRGQVDQQDKTVIPIAPINGNSIEVW